MTRGDDGFFKERADAFDRIAVAIEARMRDLRPPALFSNATCDADHFHDDAIRESWRLLLSGVRHLQCGAPGQNPGSLSGALTRASLRSSSLAAALGIAPPQFEKIYIEVDYATGAEAARSFCQCLTVGAEEDFEKSRRILHRRMLLEKPAQDAERMKQNLALSFQALTDAYARSCVALRDMI